MAGLIQGPLAFGSRPYALMLLLGALAASAAVCWAIGLFYERRCPQVPAWVWLNLGVLIALPWIAQANAESTYNASAGEFHPLLVVSSFLPTTVDAANSLPFVLGLTGLLVALPAIVDLARLPVWSHRFLGAMGWTGFSIVVAGLTLKTGLFPSASFWLGHRPWAHGEIFGPIDYHGNAATLINLALPALGLSAVEAPTANRRVLMIAVLGLMVIGAFVNASRTGLILTLGILIPLALIIFRAWRRNPLPEETAKMHWIAAAGIIGTCLLIVATTIVSGKARAASRLRTLKTDASVPWFPRYLQAKAAWEMTQKRPVFGNGLGSYKLLVQYSSIRQHFFAPKFLPGQPYTALSHTTNDYLQTLCEWGWTGLAAWVTFLGGVTWKTFAFLRRNPDSSLVAVILLALAGVYVHAMVDCPLQLPALQFVVFSYLGLAVANSLSSASSNPASICLPAI